MAKLLQKRVLVTGGAGYIGSHVCKALSRCGVEPIVCDDLSTGHEWAVQWGPLEKCDVANTTSLAAILKKYRPDAVLHFAAKSLVGESMRDPSKYFQSNVCGTTSLLQAMLDAEVGKIVFSSSCAVYGEPSIVPIDETELIAPLSPYGDAKYMAETIIRRFCEAHGMTAISLRYFNAAGADFEAEIGEYHDPETHLIPLVLEAAARCSNITIFGEDYETRDGTCIRDYIHVSDLADAHVRALILMEKFQGFEYFNLGNGSGYSVREIIETARRVTGRPIEEIVTARRKGDPPVLICDASKARAALNWTPQVTDLDNIVSSAWRWHEKYFRC